MKDIIVLGILDRDSYKDLEQNRRVYGVCGLAPTVTAGGNTHTPKIMEQDNMKIRKLTEKECMRLMGYTDEEIDILNGNFSKSCIYKFAGNSVVVDCFVEIMKEIIKDMEGKNITLEGWL